MTLHTNDETEDFTPYQVNSRREVVSILRNVAEHNQLVRMQANKGADSAMTSILAVDEFEVIIDCASSAVINQRLLESNEIAFDTALDSIRITFSVPSAESCLHDDRPALRIPLPTNLVRLQRREFYRVKTPVTNPVRCTILLPGEDGAEGLTIVAPLYNVSGGGIAIIDEKKQIDVDFSHVYENCRIDFPGGAVVVSLQVRSAQNITLVNGKQIRRLGCEFVNPSRGTEAAIQRYITKLEREQNARATGLS